MLPYKLFSGRPSIPPYPVEGLAQQLLTFSGYLSNFLGCMGMMPMLGKHLDYPPLCPSPSMWIRILVSEMLVKGLSFEVLKLSRSSEGL